MKIWCKCTPHDDRLMEYDSDKSIYICKTCGNNLPKEFLTTLENIKASYITLPALQKAVIIKTGK